MPNHWFALLAGFVGGGGVALPVHLKMPKRHHDRPQPVPLAVLQSVIVQQQNGAHDMPNFLERLAAVENFILTLGREAEPVVAAVDPALARMLQGLQADVADLQTALGGLEAIRAAVRPSGGSGLPADQQWTGTGAPPAPAATLGLRAVEAGSYDAPGNELAPGSPPVPPTA